jgi:hypothetical protein
MAGLRRTQVNGREESGMAEDTRAAEEGVMDDTLHWEIVREVGTEEEATIIVGYLRANDVPAEVESVRFNQEPVNFGDMSEVRVRVPDEHRARALELLSDREVDDLGAAADAAEAAGERIPRTEGTAKE